MIDRKVWKVSQAGEGLNFKSLQIRVGGLFAAMQIPATGKRNRKQKRKWKLKKN
jgi:hypothetical protein